eukprot:gene3771-4695_t
MTTGFTNTPSNDGGDFTVGRSTQIIVIVTDNWGVLCFDHQLKPKWETFLVDEVEKGHYHSEITVSIIPTSTTTNIMGIEAGVGGNGYNGMVVIGGRMEPKRNIIHKPHKVPIGLDPKKHSNHDFLSEDEDEDNIVVGVDGDKKDKKGHDHDKDDKPEDFEVHRDEAHFSFFALDAEIGSKIWSHEENDFKPANPHATETHKSGTDTPNHSFKQHVFSQLEHLGEVSWKEFKDSILAILPHTWSSNYDTRFQLRHFEKKSNVVKGGGGEGGDNWKSELVGVFSSDLEAFSLLTPQQKSQNKHFKNPNVLVVHNKNGIEVIQIQNGRTLCKLVLDSTDMKRNGEHFIVYIDINNDGVLDQIHTITGNTPTGKKQFSGGNQSNKLCVSLGLSGLPPRDYLFNSSICGVGNSDYTSWLMNFDSNTGTIPSTIQSVTPAIIQDFSTQRLEIVHLISSGKVTCLDEYGRQIWQVNTEAQWYKQTQLLLTPYPSIQSFSFEQYGRKQNLMAIGEALVILDMDGTILFTQELDNFEEDPVLAPPIIGDINNDGYNDVILVNLHGYNIYYIEKSYSNMLFPIIGLVIFGALLVLMFLGSADNIIIQKKPIARHLQFKKRSTD